MVAPTAPTKHTTEPTDRSMFPPVRMQSSIPVARTNTYAFCAIRLLMFWGRRIFPSVCQAKKAVTRISTRIIVYFFTNSITFVLLIVYSPLLDFRMQDMMTSCVASSWDNSPTIRPSFMT